LRLNASAQFVVNIRRAFLDDNFDLLRTLLNDNKIDFSSMPIFYRNEAIAIQKETEDRFLHLIFVKALQKNAYTRNNINTNDESLIDNIIFTSQESCESLRFFLKIFQKEQ
jgi:hypothetical protein